MKIYLVSHYFGRRCTLIVPAAVAAKIIANVAVVYDDVDRLKAGQEPRLISPYQCRKVAACNSDRDYFDRAFTTVSEII